MGNNNWALGDSLMVKPGITEKITGENLSGWQGRSVALLENGDTLTIQLDSITLKNIPPAYIAGCEEWGVSWSFLQLAFQDVQMTTARDCEEDVPVAIAAVETRYSWLSLGEQGERIRQIINDARVHNLFVFYEVWQAYLQEHLTFPFVAIVVEAQRGPIPQNAEVIVTGISLVDDTVGIVVRIRIKRILGDVRGDKTEDTLKRFQSMANSAFTTSILPLQRRDGKITSTSWSITKSADFSASDRRC